MSYSNNVRVFKRKEIELERTRDLVNAVPFDIGVIPIKEHLDSLICNGLAEAGKWYLPFNKCLLRYYIQRDKGNSLIEVVVKQPTDLSMSANKIYIIYADGHTYKGVFNLSVINKQLAMTRVLHQVISPVKDNYSKMYRIKPKVSMNNLDKDLYKKILEFILGELFYMVVYFGKLVVDPRNFEIVEASPNSTTPKPSNKERKQKTYKIIHVNHVRKRYENSTPTGIKQKTHKRSGYERRLKNGEKITIKSYWAGPERKQKAADELAGRITPDLLITRKVVDHASIKEGGTSYAIHHTL